MTVLDAYRKIAERHSLPALQQGGYGSEIMRFSSPDALWQSVLALAPNQGWLQFQSRQLHFHNKLPLQENNWGFLLCAEMITVNNLSLAINPDGAGGWCLAQYRHQDSGNLLYDELHQLAHAPKTGSLRYRRYWRYDTKQGYLQDCACFMGFTSGEIA